MKPIRMYASSYAKGLHILHDPSTRLAHAVTEMLAANGGRLLHEGETILGKCSELFYTLPTAATARKLAKILTGEYHRVTA